jgi:hypothetical protein
MRKPAPKRFRQLARSSAIEEALMKLIAVALIAAVAFAAPVASAQQTTKQANPAAEETPDFLHLSGIMAQQQMRHIKLWFAGAAGNWPLADYEIDGLKEGFDDVAKLLGDDIAQQHVGDAMAELEKSVDAKDRDNFVVAFDKFSVGCNACHRTLDHAFIVIQRPALLPYSNQNFSPQK